MAGTERAKWPMRIGHEIETERRKGGKTRKRMDGGENSTRVVHRTKDEKRALGKKNGLGGRK